MDAAAAQSVEPEAKLFTPAVTRRLVGVSLFAVAVYSVWLLYADLGALGRSLREISAGTVVVALVLSTLNYVFRWVRWHAYLKRLGIRVGVLESATVFNAGFVMTVTPAKMGEVLKSILLKRTHGIAIAVTAPIVVAERITDLAGLMLLTALGCLAFESGVIIAVVGVAMVVGILAVASWRPMGQLVLRICEKVPGVNKLVDRLAEAYESLLRLSDPKLTLHATLLSTIAWATHCAALWVVADEVMPAAIDFFESCFAYSAPLLGGTLVLIPGGLGATEASMTGALIALSDQGLSASDATAIALIVRLVTFWWAILVGIAAVAYWRVRYDR